MSKQFRAELLLFVSTFIWGSTFVFVKGSLEEASPLFFIALRFWIATVVLYIILFRSFPSLTRQTIISGTILGILVYLGFATQTVGMQYTTASKSAFFTGLLVVFTPLFQLLLEKRLPKLGNAVGIVLAAIGLYLLTSPEGSEFNVGDALTLICAFLFGWYIVYLDIVSQNANRHHLIFVQFLICSVIGTIACFLFEKPYIVFTDEIIFALVYLTLFSNLGAMWIQNLVQGDTTPTRAAVIFTLEPVIAATFAYFVRNEILGTAGIIGAGIIVTGLLVSEFSGVIPGLNRSFGKRE
ncbi:MAG: DMT family transporter [Bacteroidetes bacterium]|nr:MAG: DMT family transporter [Bacteroidota bacterium]